MQSLNIPQGHQQVMPYLIVKNAAGFFHFMQAVFGATEKMKVMRDEYTIIHAEMELGSSIIMFTDATNEFPVQTAGLFIYVDDCDAVYLKALGLQAKSIMPPANQDYGRSAGISDPYGNTWWVTSVK
ncbi:VOC family protein [Mucilaginibacter sp. CSA2-8R]|uniref:VOC family protein n=1 Tax=Mucilaginibacter sp. CSA2-8R TaxID=3141542 RepID=UPI00315C5D5D